MVFTIAGILLEYFKAAVGFNTRLVTSTGILLLSVGFASWLSYFLGKKDPQAAQRIAHSQSDERMLFIRSRAGHRAFWVSIGLTYALLIWESLSSNGSLPLLSDDTRWYWLAAAVVIPFVTYIVSIIHDEAHF